MYSGSGTNNRCSYLVFIIIVSLIRAIYTKNAKD